jgi:hypothetical protein
VTAVLRRRDGGWHLVHLAESPAYVVPADLLGPGEMEGT